MGKTIAVAGKGGTGKTTITGLLIDYLVKTSKDLYLLSMQMPMPT